MSKKKRSLLQKIILLSIFFNATSALNDADAQLYNKYKYMLKRFSTKPIPGEGLPKDRIKKFLKHLNIFENLQLKPASDNLQPAPTLPATNPLEFPDNQIDGQSNKNIEELTSLSQASQNYGNTASALNLNQDYISPSQYFTLPSQSYMSPSHNYALPSQSYLSPSQTYVLPAQSLSYRNQVLPLSLSQYYASPRPNYDAVPPSVSQNALIKYLGYLNYNSPSFENNQNLGSYSNHNPSSLINVLNYNDLDLNQNDVGNLNANFMEPSRQFEQNHGPPTLIDLSKIIDQNSPVNNQDIYEGNMFHGPDNIPLSHNGMSPSNVMSQIDDQDYTSLGIIPQNTESKPILSNLNERKDEESSIYSFFNENPELYEKLLKNGNFMTGLMNKFVMKITEKTKKDRLKKFRNKVTVKRLVPKGRGMKGPVYDEKYQLLYIPLMKVPGEDVGDKERNNQLTYQVDPNAKPHAFAIEGPNKLRNSDLYDPPHVDADSVDVLPPFKGDESPNGPSSYTQYMPDYLFTDYWTYEKPLLQDDCPDYAINVAGVCIKYPPYRKFLQ